jgi:hypothetical protein
MQQQENTIITTTNDSINSNNNDNNIQRGFDLQDNVVIIYLIQKIVGLIANSSGIKGMSECEFADYETYKGRTLNEECQIVLPDGTCVTDATETDKDI